MNGLTGLALELGFSHSYFFAMRNKTPDKFEKIFSYDKDIRESAYKYISHVKSLCKKMDEIVEEYEFNKRDYSKVLIESGINTFSSNITEIYNSDADVINRFRDDKDFISIHLSVVNRWEKVVDVFEKRDVA